MSGSSASATRVQPPPLAGLALAVTSVALALGTFMQVLDGSIANVSLPTIAGDLGVSTDNGTWVITSFAVANGVTVPLTGWLMGRFGVVRTFTVSVTLFTIASLLCGIAWSLPSLIFFRLLQGAVSGPMIPGSQALLIAIFPAHKRGTALSIWSMTTLTAPVLGPLLGGYISDNYYWGWIFLINVPVGLIAGTLSWRFLASRETPTRKIPVDKVGLLLLTFWVFSLQTVLDLGKDRDWFNNPMIVALTVCAVVGFIAWMIWELTDARPAVDLSLFKDRNFALGTLALCLGYALLFANNLLLPLWLQEYMGYTATWAGLVAAPSGAVAVVLVLVVARIKVDPRWLATVAFLSFAASFFMRSYYPPDASYWSLTLPLLVQGIAMATFFVPLLTILLQGVPPERLPSASGISNFARITAGSFAASLITTFWDRREALHQARLVEAGNDYSPAYRQVTGQYEAMGMNALQAAEAVMRQIVNQAYLLSSLELFWLCGWMALAMIVVVWFTRRPAPSDIVVAAD
ncbi:DHA2 family efflux MFS transporter permease subunit [Lichenicola cladoniae]|uniref:DHA2 family efflux MFS transporter permease subunit n=1 Tax=Lichenicola cladoniae TaxID=1484109 RepID=A0A6M8HN34_9PROT|nr:DHA2 family efflux MFS transporter permease subunit [Lichenicola cladoniae]NPD67174.1 DHA2 family efflux MFS transporter permease subunit [Acetobacteraceae bacterium]QKE89697.1 DHA2 family efflux MFS transporter permease subunit [Lichenicola cladoniae]